MKTILTVLLILFASISQAQPTLEGLLLRIQTMENTSMTIVDYNKIVDSIARRRDSILDNRLVGWVNMGRRQMNDTINVRDARVRSDVWRLDSMRLAQNAEVQTTNLNYISLVQIQMNLLQTQIRNLLTEIEAIKLRITNLKVTIQ